MSLLDLGLQTGQNSTMAHSLMTPKQDSMTSSGSHSKGLKKNIIDSFFFCTLTTLTTSKASMTAEILFSSIKNWSFDCIFNSIFMSLR